MNFDELKTAWENQDEPELVKLNQEKLMESLKSEQSRFTRAIFWRDFREVGAVVLVVVVLLATRAGEAIVWPLYLSIALLLAVGGYLLWHTGQWKKKEKQYSNSLRDELRKTSAQLDHQIGLLSWIVVWVYILPIFVVICLLHWQNFLNGGDGIADFRRGVWIAFGLGVLVYAINWLGARRIQKEKGKVDRELDSLNGEPISNGTLIAHPLARTLIAVGALALCGFLILKGCERTARSGSPIWRTELLQAPAFEHLGAFGDEETQQIDAWLAEVQASGDYPSLMVAIVGDGRVLYQGAVGYADVKTRREATPETLWHVASVTKVFTSTLAVKLHADGVVDLDRPVVEYLPEDVSISTTPQRGATITLRQLASHTSGLPRGVPDDVQSVEGRYALEPERLYEQLEGVELLSDPGSAEAYSNLGTGLLGHALERAAGIPFDRLLKEQVLMPLGMTSSGISLDDEHSELLATGYAEESPRRATEHSYRGRLAGSGGLVTSVADLSKFLLAQMTTAPADSPESDGFLTAPMLVSLHTATKLNDGKEARTALGWSVRDRASIGPYLKKNGGRSNASAWIGFVPDVGIGVAVMTNCGGPSVDEIGFWLLERAVPGADSSAFDRDPVVSEVFAKVAPFTGVRWDPESDSDQPTVRVRGEWLRVTAVDGIPIDSLMQTARKRFGEKARKRFTEDLVELLAAAGHDPGWTVTLMLDADDGKGPQPFEEEMTRRKRNEAKD